MEIRAFGDNTADTQEEYDDWKPTFEDEPTVWNDCIKDVAPDSTIPPYTEKGYNIIDGQVCLDPNHEGYPELKKFFKSHVTYANIDVDSKYDDYVLSDYDESLLPKNIRVLSYALSTGDFEIVMLEAIMQGSLDNVLYDIDQAYFDFMFAAAHIPAFCGEKSADDPRDMIEVCRHELSAFFLDVVANSRFDATSQKWSGLTELEDPTCAEAVMDTARYAGECDHYESTLVLDEQFATTAEAVPLYRRGFGVGLKGVEDYAALSAIVFGDRTVLLREPWLVSDDLSLAFGAAMYKWMQRGARDDLAIRYPSGHEVITGLWQGNEFFPAQDVNTVIKFSLNQDMNNPRSCATLGQAELEELIGAYWFF